MKHRGSHEPAHQAGRPGLVRSRWLVGPYVTLAVLGTGVIVALTMLMLHGGANTSGAAVSKLNQISDVSNASVTGTHAPKSIGTVTQAASCPREPVQTGIFTGDNGGFHADIINEAVIAPDATRPYEYVVFAGQATAGGPHGLLIVMRLDVDPCSSAATGTQVRYFATPGNLGSARLTGVAGEVVTFANARGSTGRFDYVTGAFS